MRRSCGNLLDSKALSVKKTNRLGPFAHLRPLDGGGTTAGETYKAACDGDSCKTGLSGLLPKTPLRILSCASFGGGQWLDMAKLGP